MNRISQFFLALCVCTGNVQANPNSDAVKQTEGLIAFWEFSHPDNQGLWWSHSTVQQPAFPVYLRRMGDPLRYSRKTWPYTDSESALCVDTSGPFGCGMLFNRGYLYAECPRSSFDGSPLDLSGKQPFTLIATF